MDNSNSKEFGSMMNTVCEMYGKPNLSKFALALWWNALKDYTLNEVKHGLSTHTVNPDSGQFMPKPADIVKAIRGTSADNSSIAWSKIDYAVRSVGAYEDVVFDDPIIHVVIDDMGGWIRMCTDHDDKAWPFVQRDFETRYRGYSTRQSLPEYTKQLIGISNAGNSIAGYKKKEPILIGDSSRALQVLESGSSSHVKKSLTLTDAKLFENKKLGVSI